MTANERWIAAPAFLCILMVLWLWMKLWDRDKKIPFFISYSATLESDLGNFEKALSIADDFNAQINDPNIPQPYVLYGSIYLKMDSLSLATSNIDKALQLDPNHIFAQRFKNQISQFNKILA